MALLNGLGPTSAHTAPAAGKQHLAVRRRAPDQKKGDASVPHSRRGDAALLIEGRALKKEKKKERNRHVFSRTSCCCRSRQQHVARRSALRFGTTNDHPEVNEALNNTLAPGPLAELLSLFYMCLCERSRNKIRKITAQPNSGNAAPKHSKQPLLLAKSGKKQKVSAENAPQCK